MSLTNLFVTDNLTERDWKHLSQILIRTACLFLKNKLCNQRNLPDLLTGSIGILPLSRVSNAATTTT